MSGKANLPLMVVDVGNTRIKWGWCADGKVRDSVSLPPDDALAWQQQLKAWTGAGPFTWVVSGVHPVRRDRLVEWLRQHGQPVRVVTSPQQLPLNVGVAQPEKVGIDRLLNAVAVNFRRAAGSPAVIVDAGSAVTVDYVDEQGVFRGGAILPGLRLMAQALHDYTALLPLIQVDAAGEVPGTSTTTAMKAGIFCAVLGGVKEVIQRLVPAAPGPGPLLLVLGGGDGPLLAQHLPWPAEVWPLMTLEGLRLTARNLP
jgi:type III pantothenate kinase